MNYELIKQFKNIDIAELNLITLQFDYDFNTIHKQKSGKWKVKFFRVCT